MSADRPGIASASHPTLSGNGAVRRVFYAASGPGDLIASHRHWRQGENNPTEVSVTFSSQIEQFCREIGAEAYLVSMHPGGERIKDGPFTIEHRPKRPRSGHAFHAEELRYALSLLRTARAFGADVALLDSGVTHYFLMGLFPAAGIPVIPILHNTLWPSGFRPARRRDRLIQRLDAAFLQHGPAALVAVSPEAERQADELAPGHPPIFQIRAQFLPEFFASIPPPPPHGQRPFQVMFVGRVEQAKGVLDIPAMAARIERSAPGLVRWVICGRGSELDALNARVAELGVGAAVDVRGWVSLDELRAVYAESHAAIIPTRSDFAEGLAMTAAEAILAGRPIVTNPIVPALELLAPAALAAQANDPDSHADAVLRLATDAALYDRLLAATRGLGAEFYDRSMGLTAVLHRALAEVGA